MSTTLPSDFGRLSLFVFLGVFLLAVPQAAMLPLIDRDEPRFAEASREMLQSGNYIVPTFNHAPRYAKPPLIYWSQTVSYRLFGENAFAARLPSLLATAGTALLLLAWGVQLGDKNIGLIAAFSYAFCLQTVQQGRVATADALLIFFMTLTGLAGWNLLQLAKQKTAEHWKGWGWLLVLGFAGGFLAKGPEAWLPLLALLTEAWSLGRRVMLAFIAIFALGLLVVAAWAVPAFIATHGDYWRMGLSEGVGQRMVTGMQGHGTSTVGWYFLMLPYYLILFWIVALPWSPLLVIQWKKLFSGVKLDDTDSYLLINVAVIFFIFSLMVTKLPHYTLPAFPFIALFFGRRWMAAGLSPRLPIKLTVGFGVGFALFAAISIPTALAREASPSPIGVLVRQAEAAGELTNQTDFTFVDFQEPNGVWEARRVVNPYVQAIPESEVLTFLKERGPRAVVLSTALWKRIEGTSPVKETGWKTYETTGLNGAKVWDSSKHVLALVDLTLVVKM